MQFLATLDNKPLPGPISWSAQKNRLAFDEALYRQNGISAEQVTLLNKILSQIPYAVCPNGCDYTINGQTVSLDKVKQSLTITDGNQRYVQPQTMMGFVHNQALDVRTASNEYRAVSAFGQGYLGLPAQSYGYLNWYYNDSQNFDTHTTDQGVSTWYLQKNFATTYLRSGRQDSRDFAAGSVSTSLSPSFDQFVTLGSQDNLKRDNQSAGKMVLFATADGDYEFYRDGRLIRRVPAVIGRNEIDYNQLPGGFYSVEVRLVNRSGQTVSTESQQIANINYGEGTGWYLTLGKAQDSLQNLLSAGASFQTNWFAVSSALLKGSGNTWAMEHNLTRPMQVAEVDVTPTVGVMAGEKRVGGYASLSASHQQLGSLTVSQYQNTSVSEFNQAANSTSLGYSRQFGPTRLGYNYSNYGNSERHQLQSNWNWRGNGVWAVISTGVQKGGYNNSSNNYGLYLNTTIMLDRNTGTLNAAYNNGKLHTGGSYTREFEDSTGTSYAGVDFSEIGRSNAVGLNARRSGTRGDASVRVGIDNHITSGSFNYNGMLAASKDGIALGRTSPSGAAMLVTTPKLGEAKYGFKVEGNPVGSGSTYAVPLASYQDLTFARAQTVDASMDMNIRLPANVVRAHPGQVYPVKAEVAMNLLYNGFMVDRQGNPVSGTLKDTGDIVYPNGLFSVASSTILKEVMLESKQGRYRCDLSQPNGNYYTCVAG
ncbi:MULTISPECIES: TcfC E-set like domain-containing protein [unclassified Serratia (in: enterobacteria)]|uniref:TcfC E-set like domain-containing protein n=1 Tax=unclassified Serratia (in: enterobacteria) TaxID=2647522 RepID=UPI0006894A04|nr:MULTISPECIES: TcfC E-set like domain-containing protein [unclassified Serratia (in: enterobacteria)]